MKIFLKQGGDWSQTKSCQKWQGYLRVV